MKVHTEQGKDGRPTPSSSDDSVLGHLEVNSNLEQILGDLLEFKGTFTRERFHMRI